MTSSRRKQVQKTSAQHRAGELLGVRCDADGDELRRAFHRYVRRHHPDVGGRAATLQAGVEAYRLLSGIGSAAMGRVVFYRRPRGRELLVAWMRARWGPPSTKSPFNRLVRR